MMKNDVLNLLESMTAKHQIKVILKNCQGSYAYYSKDTIIIGYRIGAWMKSGYTEYKDLQYLLNEYKPKDEKAIYQLLCLHEVSHIIAHRQKENLKPHGVEFQRVFFELLNTYNGVKIC